MGLLGARPALLLLVFGGFFYFAWGIGNGFVTWEKPKTACFSGLQWVTAVPKQPFLSIGKLTLKYQPWSWTCPPDHAYDPSVYKVQDGQLVPLHDSTTSGYTPVIPH